MRYQNHHELPGLDCGLCGYRTCNDFTARLADDPTLLKRCVHLSDSRLRVRTAEPTALTCHGCTTAYPDIDTDHITWRDSLDRPFDFFLEHFPEDPGPKEIIIPHNPILTRELDVKVGDILIGRPLGMSCGCPVTHCGIATDVDQRTGVMSWCVTGPMQSRQLGYKDLGYYIAEGYEGLIRESKCDIKIGMRYFFQPKMCMLQWRHSGLVNYLNRTSGGWQVRLEGLWIG
ncbi:MAG: hypothetical protein CSYNP_03758 [Syntrophus sp. SKADARSKE-3]|nr:hypothetical protein [Syntrophus sp. SKADARSKE-3]